jgi:RHS repeat-associated protein
MRLTLAGPTLKRCSNLFQTNLWQGSKLIAETDNDKHWQSYLYEPDSYRPLALVHGNAQQDNIKLYWYQNDHLGTPIALTGSLGDTLYECQYNAYGQIINETYHQDDIDSLPDNPLRFQGQYYDEETKLHYNLNRYYDPFTGRYITQDPLGILGGLNSYQYAGSDPINWIDPLGLIKVENNGFEGINGEGTIPTKGNTPNDFINSPQSIWGRSIDEIVKDFTNAGYKVNVRQSSRGSGQAVIIEVKGHPEISQIQIHPGGGRHGGSYYKISTTTQGTIKVVDSSTYKPSTGEKAKIIYKPKE